MRLNLRASLSKILSADDTLTLGGESLSLGGAVLTTTEE